MRVHVHTLCWNEVDMLKYFFRHYEPWVERFYFYDDDSTDGGREMLEARADVSVETTPHDDPDSWVISAQTIHNRAWKRSIGEADWVVVTNVDEHLFHPAMARYLTEMHAAGATALPAAGYQMVSRDRPPSESVLWRDYGVGAPDALYSRMAIFRPDKITATNYSPGRHKASLEGEVVFPERDEIANLHYKHLNLAKTRERQVALGAKLGAKDNANLWGAQYAWSEQELQDYFDKLHAQSLNVTALASHPAHLAWWRPSIWHRGSDQPAT